MPETMVNSLTGKTGVAINTMRARLTVLGFNLAISTFQIINTRALGGGTQLEGFETTVHLSTGTVLLTGLALSTAAIVVFMASSMLDGEGTCDRRMFLAGDLLMYLAVSQTVSGFFGSYGRVLEVMELSSGEAALSSFRDGLNLLGALVWVLVTYVGPIFAMVRCYHGRIYTFVHIAFYVGMSLGVSRLWWAAQLIEGRLDVSTDAGAAWLYAFFSPLYW